MKTKRVTIKDIAELAGVSKATASLVLNGRGKELRVAQETRERVQTIAREQHYQPSIHARSLRDNRSHTIGLVVPEITNYGFRGLLPRAGNAVPRGGRAAAYLLHRRKPGPGKHGGQ
ncbi:Catabolite repressor/activator [Raoultella terrigena]|uniref:Catabolite repressor/activator n=1 Tax=Raoultella terrigena TaxID=577 RepID=A0A3P8K1D8_RAOTE|nr:Catabolite repressor/activator [Raoultella terrigena]